MTNYNNRKKSGDINFNKFFLIFFPYYVIQIKKKGKEKKRNEYQKKTSYVIHIKVNFQIIINV